MMEFRNWFERMTDHHPYGWQVELAASSGCRNRCIRIPTGLGKTQAVLASWAWHRMVRRDDGWPLRLVLVLPMRVLVEQTEETVRSFLDQLGLLWDGRDDHDGKVGVHLLMGGEDAGEWHLHPEHPAILIGTQDMLLSRALNRGYACPRARWPMEYALLNQDALWVMDEVQLMDVGLITTVQLQAFRDRDRGKAFRPCFSWWMSATLQTDWFGTVDTHWLMDEPTRPVLRIPQHGRTDDPWSIRKELEVCQIQKDDQVAFAELVLGAHGRLEESPHGRITLVVCNTVPWAVKVHNRLAKLLAKTDSPPTLHLVHSRFRGSERACWRSEFLARRSCATGANHIIVATQVVEAGVDISAGALITELAPWPSLVQRMGRCARYGGTGHVMVVDRGLDEKQCLPYAHAALAAAKQALSELPEAGILAIEEFGEQLAATAPDLLRQLYVYEYTHLLTERENAELFSTGADLTGADTDIARFIRSGEERDVLVFWADIPVGETPSASLAPERQALCRLPIGEVDKWLFKPGANVKAWRWDYLDGTWQALRRGEAYPGLTICVPAVAGGYDVLLGWTGKSTKEPVPVVGLSEPLQERNDLAEGREAASHSDCWKTIATHGAEVLAELRSLAAALDAPEEWCRASELAALVHDWGKAHPVFRACMKDTPADLHSFALAKAPTWVAPSAFFSEPAHGSRKGFRHELASALACFELLRRIDPWHEALAGSFRDYFEAGVLEALPDAADPPLPEPVTALLADLTASEFDLAVYLVCAHHGKIRANWQATPADQDFPWERGELTGEGQPLRGVREGDSLPSCTVGTPQGDFLDLPPLHLHLAPAAAGLSSRYGRSWGERTQTLVAHLGPYQLAFLETLLRVADIRASRSTTPDPLLEGRAQ